MKRAVIAIGQINVDWIPADLVKKRIKESRLPWTLRARESFCKNSFLILNVKAFVVSTKGRERKLDGQSQHPDLILTASLCNRNWTRGHFIPGIKFLKIINHYVGNLLPTNKHFVLIWPHARILNVIFHTPPQLSALHSTKLHGCYRKCWRKIWALSKCITKLMRVHHWTITQHLWDPF